MAEIMLNLEKFKKENRVCAFIRHGEKDTKNFCLTDAGKQNIREFSQLLRSLQKNIVIYSSPEPRCIETATIINSAANDLKTAIEISTVLGKPGIQVKNEAAYDKLVSRMRCRDIFRAWKKGLFGEAINDADIIQGEMIKFFSRTSLNNGVTIYISQSGTVAFTAYSLGITDYKATDEDWVDYLDGYALSLKNGRYYF